VCVSSNWVTKETQTGKLNNSFCDPTWFFSHVKHTSNFPFHKSENSYGLYEFRSSGRSPKPPDCVGMSD
jgi:hypothetical protein